MQIPKPKAVIFDMDGLLVDSERMSRKASQITAAEYGYQITDKLYLEMVGRQPDDVKKLILNRFGNDFPLEVYQKKRKEYLQNLERDNGVPLQAGVESILSFLEMHDITISVVTNSAREDAETRLSGIMDRLHSITARNEAPRNKPYPDPYLAALDKLNMTASACLVLEDTDTGAFAALAAGIDVIIVPDLKQPSKEAAEKAIAICHSLSEVEELFRASWDSG